MPPLRVTLPSLRLRWLFLSPLLSLRTTPSPSQTRWPLTYSPSTGKPLSSRLPTRLFSNRLLRFHEFLSHSLTLRLERSGGCAVLYQIDSEDRPRPLGFWSKRFDKTEVGMCSRNAECFVVWAAVTKWKWTFKSGRVTIYR